MSFSKHTPNCECPIHIEEDTTKVKRVALITLALFIIGFIITLCVTNNEPTHHLKKRHKKTYVAGQQ